MKTKNGIVQNVKQVSMPNNYARNSRMGTVFMGLPLWTTETLHGFLFFSIDSAWATETLHGFFRKKCCRRLAGYGNTFSQ